MNHTTVAQAFNTSLQFLWPNRVAYNNVLLLLTDGAANMLKAGESLSILYPRMLHVTCIAHAQHRVAEAVRSNYSELDRFIATIKAIFTKAPARIRAFHIAYL